MSLTKSKDLWVTRLDARFSATASFAAEHRLIHSRHDKSPRGQVRQRTKSLIRNKIFIGYKEDPGRSRRSSYKELCVIVWNLFSAERTEIESLYLLDSQRRVRFFALQQNTTSWALKTERDLDEIKRKHRHGHLSFTAKKGREDSNKVLAQYIQGSISELCIVADYYPHDECWSVFWQEAPRTKYIPLWAEIRKRKSDVRPVQL